ncbi:hypothetical protein [Caballeronia sp.]|uniref:hypothetical protein n=1 Tax=Caballeronia sp. TaxID=1931223 RepID=UPI003C59E0DC
MSIANPERLLIADDDPNLLAAYVLLFQAYGTKFELWEMGWRRSPNTARGIQRQLFSIRP